MANIFFISDTHFGHEACYTKFKREDGSPLRPFSSAAEGDEEMVARWNLKVRPHDKVYHLGDITMSTSARSLEILGRLNGEKILIRGNHDLHKISQYLQYFKDVRGVHQFDGMVLTHIPIHPESLSRWKVNIHGHLHYRVVNRTFYRDFGNEVVEYTDADPRYICVSVEQINYTPISIEEIRQRIT